MRIISRKDYDEYRQLKENVLIQSKFDSVRDTKHLKDDIDIPVRSIIAMLALLGCNPIFSCCGFDYDGQPLHKSHEYGCSYFTMGKNEKSVGLVGVLEDYGIVIKEDGKSDGWSWWEHKNAIFLRSAFTREHKEMKYPWVDSRTCIHYCEIAVFNIDKLEKFLWRLRTSFLDVITLVDTNHVYKRDRKIRNWQYPSLEPWIITADNVSAEMGL